MNRRSEKKSIYSEWCEDRNTSSNEDREVELKGMGAFGTPVNCKVSAAITKGTNRYYYRI